ncbi:hypothetical protein KFL_002610130 [Klebsormidium nitens]|uniref:Uncharacterized protein n=1 Tax=Klebsormidium nitens TaxID=105231 RepID=A0A1Y1IB31_KLENI|nr:hypothetical protein KFL_002610130 [Klebsormidium nitens]|eukprot:GAQ85927.1 hypothetical protein KFL_002610130 [Klebsormidium nitens]
MAPLPQPSGRSKSSLPSTSPSLALVVLTILLATTVPSSSNRPRVNTAQALELPMARALGGRKVLQNDPQPVVQDYTAYCTPSRSTDIYTSFDEVATPFADLGDYLAVVFIDLCNSVVFTVDGKPFKVPATITGTVTQYPLSDGRRIRVTIDGSNVFTLPQVLTSDGSDGYTIMGLNPFPGGFDAKDVTNAEFLKVISLATVHFDLNFELHDNGTAGDPFTTTLTEAVGPPFGFVDNPLVNFIELDISVTARGPLRRTPPPFPYNDFPVGNPATITITEKLTKEPVPDGTAVKSYKLDILPPDDGFVLQIMQKLVDPTILLTAVFPPDVPTPANETAPPNPPTALNPLTSAGRAPVNGTCGLYSDAPNQCFSASGTTSVCCRGQCLSPPPEPAACTEGSPAPTSATTATPTPTPSSPSTTTAAPSPTATPASTKAPCDYLSATPNPCFNVNGSDFVCCPRGCAPGAPGAVATCAA